VSDLDLIKDRTDIVELVGETVQLTRSGKAFKGRCPFHNERTPSFYVDPVRRSWHCFGACSTGGDVFTFLERRDNLDFAEALRVLAERAGVELSGRKRATDERSPRLIQANEAAAGFFHHVLLNSQEAEAARTYAERRGLDAATIRDFELGYAPDRWDSLAAHLSGQSYAREELIEAGLVIEGERGVHDRFRGRLIFPIRDERGRVLGFGGRALGDAQPKYLNSPQSPIFDKGSLLYTLDRAKDAIRSEGRAVIVEGYLDAITAHQFGYRNVVASLGTALTERQIDLVKRFTKRVALALDSDAAGLEAALRGEQLIRDLPGSGQSEVVVDWGNLVRVQSRAPVEVRIFSVPGGKDPDEAIRADPAGWPGWVDAALPPFEFRLRYELAHVDRTNPAARVQMLERLLPLLAEVGDRALQAAYLSQLAVAAGVREDDARTKMNTLIASNKRGQVLPNRERTRQPAVSASPAAAGSRAENFCLALLLRFPELREIGQDLNRDIFLQLANRAIFEHWLRGEELSEDALPDELRAQWRALDSVRLLPAVLADPAAALHDNLSRMALRQMEERKRLLTAMIVEQREGADRLAAAAPSDTVLTGPETLAAESSDAELAGQILADLQMGRSLHELEAQLRTGRDAVGQ
jgi:DNA primase